MRARAHRDAALNLERIIEAVSDQAINPYAGRAVVELECRAAFHWIAYGYAQKHHAHPETADGLDISLRRTGEPALADLWLRIDAIRRAARSAPKASPETAHAALNVLPDIRAWASR